MACKAIIQAHHCHVTGDPESQVCKRKTADKKNACRQLGLVSPHSRKRQAL